MMMMMTVTEIWLLKDNGVTSLTFLGHVTSSKDGRREREKGRNRGGTGKGKGKWKGKKKGKGKVEGR